MPAHKRSLSENRDDDEDPLLDHQHQAKQPRREPELDDEELDRSRREDGEELEEEDGEGSEESVSSGIDEKPEFVTVELPEIRKDVQCPICLGIIKKTRTVMECLHRFCRECIDKSMRLGNNECPACRTHCASRRSLRDDPNYDALIAALYPDIDKYDEEELAFHEEERNRNKQIQAAIAEISQRQTEALVKRRALGKDTSAYTMRSQRRNGQSRRRRGYRGIEHESEDNENENDNNEAKYSSSTDERSAEVKHRRNRRHPGARLPQPSPSSANSDGTCLENDTETSREGRGRSPGLVRNSEMLGWGKGGTRSHTRHSGSNTKSSRISRLSKLTDYLRSAEVNCDEIDVHVMLVSSDTKRTPSLQQPYLRCQPCSSVGHLREYVAGKISLRAEDIEVMAVKGNGNIHHDEKAVLSPSTSTSDPDPASLLVNQCKDKLQAVEGQEALLDLKANFSSVNHHLFLAYRQKEASEQQVPVKSAVQ